MTKALLALLMAFIACSGMARATEDVTTVAGNGASGIADGPALKATFLFPVGLAVARDGSIYISDQAAQRIRLLTPRGEVRTIAGSGAIVRPGIIVRPGYRDGPALQAQFNGPEGIAIGPDGALYIADSYNGCIRRLWHGQVTTTIGKCGRNKQPLRRNPAMVVDGPRDTASLMHPTALAFDSSGTLYIADDGGGLRRFANGKLTTVHFPQEPGLPQADVLGVIGVTIAGKTDPTVLVSTHGDLFAYHPATGQTDIFYPDSLSDGNPFGHPNQVAAIDKQQFLFTDLITANLRYLRLPVLPFNGSNFTRVIAGGRLERGSDNAGFANGMRENARFYDPMGIAIAGNFAFVADAGNRRIRKIRMPAFRVSETGFGSPNEADDKYYNVALVGASWSFWDSLGDDSICGHIEATLNRSHRFRKPVRCHSIRMDAGKVDAFENYIKTIFTFQHMDLIILDAEAYSSNLPGAGEGEDRTRRPLVPGSPTTFAQYFRARMQGLLDLLTPLRTRLALLMVLNAQDTSDAEWIVAPFGFYRAPPSDVFHVAFGQIIGALKGKPILHYDMYDDIVRYELSVSARPLYGPTGEHPNSRGNAFFGDHIAEALLKAGLASP